MSEKKNLQSLGINNDVYRYNGLTQKEWLAEGRAYIVKHGTKKGWENSKFIREDGEPIELYSKKRPTTPQSVLDVGGHYDVRKVSTRNNFVNNRQGREKVPEKIRSDFSSDAEFKRYKKYVSKGVKSNTDLSNAQSVDGKEFDHGHIKSLKAGGSNDPADQRLENRESNRSTQQNADPTDAQLKRTGNARSWEEAGEFYRDGRPANYFDLTPQDKQRIWSGEDADAVVDQRKAALKTNPLAKPADSRFTRLGIKRDPTSQLRMNGLGGVAGLMLDPEAAKKFAQGDILGGLQTGGTSAAFGEFTSQVVQRVGQRVGPHLGQLFAGASRYVAPAARYVTPVAKAVSPVGQAIVGTQVANELVKAGTGEGFVKKVQNVQDRQRTANINAQQQQTAQQLAIKRKQTGQDQSFADTVTKVIDDNVNHLKYAIKNPLSIFGIN